jgi:tetratricopeptide (TPR) repeat protein
MNLAVDLPVDLRDARIALIGRLGRVPRRRLAGVLQERNATLTRRITGQSDLVVVAHGAVTLVQSGKLGESLAQADQRGLPLLSEHGMLRRLGLLPEIAPEPRSHSLRELASWAALNPATARLLALFDIIEDVDGRYSFRDLKAARDFARRLDHREDLPAALETALDVRRRHGFRRHLAETPLTGMDDQIAMDLGDDVESFDEVWERALDAETSHDYAAAEDAYRRCVAIRPRDAVCLFHLADVVAELDRRDEARVFLHRALAVRPDFAEAWFNLSLLETGVAVTNCLERAVAADPACIEAVHDLALSHMKDGAYDKALPFWERYLTLAPGSQSPCADKPAVERAKRALMLCRMARLRPKANGTPTR